MTAPTTEILFIMAAEQEYGPAMRRTIRPLITGVGPIEAAIGTSRHLKQAVSAGEKPDFVVSLGSAGSKRCATGTVWQVSSVSWRDMDASHLGFAKGITPFADHPFAVSLLTPLPGVPAATLFTGGDILDRDDYDGFAADLADMETFAVVRACQRFDIPVIGPRGVSDGPGDRDGAGGWTDRLALLDGRLASVINLLPAALTSIG